MQEQTIIRLARPGDIDTLMPLYREHLNAANPDLPVDDRVHAHWQSILDNPMLHYFVAEVDGLVVATCNLTIVPNLTYNLSPYAVIENVVTHADYRRRGLGRMLMETAISTAWEAGCHKVMLMSGAGRTEAHRFYESLGFDGDSKKGFSMRRTVPLPG